MKDEDSVNAGAPLNTQDSAPRTQLARRLGPFDATMIVMGGIIGSGIFMNPYVVARQVHTPLLILGAWVAGHSRHRRGVMGLSARRERSTHLLQLGPRRHLLRIYRRLDAVEEAFQPADELRLGDPQLRVARGLVAEGQSETVKLLDQLGGQPVLELLDRRLVDLP